MHGRPWELLGFQSEFLSELFDFFANAGVLSGQISPENSPAFADSGYDLVKFFFLLTFAAAIPAIISGGIAERARFYPQLFATAILVIYLDAFVN
mgnify:CR=1 FL=1